MGRSAAATKRAVPPAFDGFRPATFAFFRDLAANQSKPWFEANRPVYEREVLGPCMALAEDVAAELSRRELPLTGSAKRSTFRIHRDVRFSKDKTPYKTYTACIWMRPGFKKESGGVIYLHIADGGCFLGAGFWEVERPQLDAIRAAIRDQPDAYLEAVATAAAASLALDTRDSLTRMPRGFEDVTDPALTAAIKTRHLVFSRPLLKRDVASAALVGRILDATEAVLPLLQFGWDAMAAAGPPPAWSLLG